MSAPTAGKFQDHYEVLALDFRADSEAIQTAYFKLAAKYNPKTSPEGDQEKFDAVTLAFEVLSDAVSRKEFDKVKGYGEKEGPPKFSGKEFFIALGRQGELRNALLCLLYDRRRVRPFTPSLSMRNLESMLEATAEELNFVLWYLKQRGHAAADDKSAMQITVEGMDYLEGNRPDPDLTMRFLKKEALKDPPPPLAPPAAPPTQSTTNAGTLESLRRSMGASLRQRQQ